MFFQGKSLKLAKGKNVNFPRVEWVESKTNADHMPGDSICDPFHSHFSLEVIYSPFEFGSLDFTKKPSQTGHKLAEVSGGVSWIPT